MRQGKRILIVSDCVCYPPNEGNCRRIYNIIKSMRSLGHVVDYLYYSPQRSTYELQMKNFLGRDNFIFFRITKLKIGFFYKHSKGFFIERFAPPNTVDLMFSLELAKKVHKLTQDHKYDVVWVEYPCQSKILEEVNDSIIKVIDTHDKFAYRNYKVFPFMHEVANYSITFLGERKALSRADYVIAIQQEEEKYFRKLLCGKGTKVITLGDNHDAVRNEVSMNHNICFVGGRSGLNADAVNWFINKVLPIITQCIDDCIFFVVGRVCELINADKENIQLLGMVEDIDTVYRDCRVVVNPVRMGTGLNIKTIEAISHGKPLVTTSAGARGLKCRKPIMAIADDSTTFAKAVINLLVNDFQCEFYINNCFEFMKRYNQNNLKAINKIINLEK